MNPFLNRTLGFTRKSNCTKGAEFKNGTPAYLDDSAQNTHRRIALPEDNETTRMTLWSRATLKSAIVPGGLILAVASLFIQHSWVSLSPSALAFSYYAVF